MGECMCEVYQATVNSPYVSEACLALPLLLAGSIQGPCTSTLFALTNKTVHFTSSRRMILTVYFFSLLFYGISAGVLADCYKLLMRQNCVLVDICVLLVFLVKPEMLTGRI